MSQDTIPQHFRQRIQEAMKILILSANPRGTSQLRLDEEMREIKEGLRRSRYREQFSLETLEAVRYRDIHRAILSYEPNIIHFSGHGVGDEGLAFEDETGQVKLVDAETLAGLFELFAEQLECVILNACYSKIQAEVIAQYIPYVIGMTQAMGDKAAIEFAVGFYDALGAGKTVEFAKKLGCNLIRTAGIAEHLTPVLIKKPDIEETATQLNIEQDQDKKYEMTFVFSGTLTEDSEVEFNGKKTKIKALLQHLETFCDGELTIYEASQGSVRLRLGGSPEDLEKLQELFKSGELNEVLGIPVKDVQLITTETTVLTKNLKDIFLKYIAKQIFPDNTLPKCQYWTFLYRFDLDLHHLRNIEIGARVTETIGVDCVAGINLFIREVINKIARTFRDELEQDSITQEDFGIRREQRMAGRPLLSQAPSWMVAYRWLWGKKYPRWQEDYIWESWKQQAVFNKKWISFSNKEKSKSMSRGFFVASPNPLKTPSLPVNQALQMVISIDFPKKYLLLLNRGRDDQNQETRHLVCPSQAFAPNWQLLEPITLMPQPGAMCQDIQFDAVGKEEFIGILVDEPLDLPWLNPNPEHPALSWCGTHLGELWEQLQGKNWQVFYQYFQVGSQNP